MQPNMRFTGIFIPVEIMQIEGLNATDWALLSVIDALYSEEHGGCFATNAYLAAKVTKETSVCRKSLYKLIKMGLVEEERTNGERILVAKINEKVSEIKTKLKKRLGEQRCTGGVHRCTGGVCTVAHPTRYIYSYIKEDIYRRISCDSCETADAISRFFFSLIQKKNEAQKKPNFKTWNSEIEKIIKLDKRDPKQIIDLIDWAQSHEFWGTNILSPKALRKQYDTLLIQMQAEQAKQAKDPKKKAKDDEKLIEENKQFATALLTPTPTYRRGHTIEIKDRYVYIANTQGSNCLAFNDQNFKKLLESYHHNFKE